MPKKLKVKSKKVTRLKKRQEPVQKIEKKPLSPEERAEKLRKDRLKIAKRYEEMKLYDDALKYYKKLGMAEDVKRILQLKKEVYITKAQEFEAEGKYKDARRLYENLKMGEEVERLSRLIDAEELGVEAVAGDVEVEAEAEVVSAEEDDYTEAESEAEGIMSAQVAADSSEEIDFEDAGADIDQEEVSEVIETGVTPVTKKKIFKICPYCAEELNLPKKPNFCPYCKEPFV